MWLIYLFDEVKFLFPCVLKLEVNTIIIQIGLSNRESMNSSLFISAQSKNKPLKKILNLL